MSVYLIDNSNNNNPCLPSGEIEAEQNFVTFSQSKVNKGKSSLMEISSLAMKFKELNLLNATINFVTGRQIGFANVETRAGSESKCQAEDEENKMEEKTSLKIINLDEVAWHDTFEDCWMVIYDYVYDVTCFLKSHPGGQDILLEYAGRDATLAFVGSGHSRAAKRILENYLIGELPPNERIFRTSNGIKVGDFV